MCSVAQEYGMGMDGLDGCEWAWTWDKGMGTGVMSHGQEGAAVCGMRSAAVCHVGATKEGVVRQVDPDPCRSVQGTYGTTTRASLAGHAHISAGGSRDWHDWWVDGGRA
ncbi:hypothetical protein GGTG_13974 [Gaeumannomyces tritici R3-111a-1]|uniref:Uncharacterized protein n=1 Tax=Gaeumannomyces tritici (strain R3-111a-1) TaxID=644352 RepID=J3PKC2_GAET3|nr:hypothetical protein GGTG_13974 [Gaeumannomyces tritici R3-111a-1]EJT68449.1 hypothetical protein GGTG_13974 [Gaeumannomyces tritici R3-111a-1]